MLFLGIDQHLRQLTISMLRDHLPPVREEPDEVDKLTLDEIEVKSYVGGIVKSFERKAA
ncbi:hypothetical protein [uncultured Rubinisphaera sp.]|uniref:hypothetical protein n=1 Tax=uncultured Rubinisphaera sp. TaxID=1678686 RepID=UPI0030DA2D9C|tara:strand:+ start:150 stop:326 length:177 start_codon:yes stop_codon:yes gene_type:complete